MKTLTDVKFDKLNTLLVRHFVGHPQCEQVYEFFTVMAPRMAQAPAAAAVRFNHAYDGGLLDHSCEVAQAAVQVAQELGLAVPVADVVLAGLLHDLHKLGDAAGVPYYIPNVLAGGKRSEKVPYTVNPLCHDFYNRMNHPENDAIDRQALRLLQRNQFPDGELSLSLVAAMAPEFFSTLSPEVRFAIRHHDGMYGEIRRELSGNETPLQLVLHFADMLSSRGMLTRR